MKFKNILSINNISDGYHNSNNINVTYSYINHHNDNYHSNQNSSHTNTSLINNNILSTISILFLSNIFGNILPILLSSFCHQFYYINKKWHLICWYLDFIGILTGMLCTGLSFIYLVFYCIPIIIYILTYILIICYIISLQLCWKKYYYRYYQKLYLYPYDRFPEFSLILTSFGWIATILPIVLVLLLCYEYRSIYLFQKILFYSISGPIIMSFGIIIFAQGNFPEKYTKAWGLSEGFFDIIGHSHQFWHLISAVLQFCWILVLRKHFHARIEYGCL